MIQVQELRYGNKVYDKKGDVITVQQILFNSIVYDTQMKIKKERAGNNGAYQATYTSEMVEVVKEADYQELQPIVLTPRILQRCGFRNFIREEWVISTGAGHSDFEFTEDGLRLRHPTPSRIAVKHLHQLQNFFFALTGKELEVNIGVDENGIPFPL